MDEYRLKQSNKKLITLYHLSIKPFEIKKYDSINWRGRIDK